MIEKQQELECSIMNDKLSVLKPTLSVRISPDTPVKEVVDIMVERKIGAVLIEDDGQLAGIFSERDIVNKIALNYGELMDNPIQDYMTSDPESLSIDHTLVFALNRMDDGGYRHIPVTDEKNYPVGMVALRDIIRYIDHKCLDGPE